MIEETSKIVVGYREEKTDKVGGEDEEEGEWMATSKEYISDQPTHSTRIRKKKLKGRDKLRGEKVEHQLRWLRSLTEQ